MNNGEESIDGRKTGTKIVSITRVAIFAALIQLATLTDSRGASAGSVLLDYFHDRTKSFGNAALCDVVIDQTATGTYYAAISWNTGYMGLQRGGSGFFKHVHFSVWDADNAPQTEVIATGAGTITERFGGEGTGWKTMHSFEWQEGVRYRMSVSVSTTASYTDFAGYFYDPSSNRWIHLATLRRHEGTRPLVGFSSFLVDFGGSLESARAASFGNCWVRDLSGRWMAQNEARFFNSSSQSNLNAEPAGDLVRLATGGSTVNSALQYQFFPLSASGTVGVLPAELSAGNASPIITAQPQLQSVAHGGTASFSVSIEDAGLDPVLQWFKNGSPLLGETNASLSITDVQVSDMGRYWVTISTVQNTLSTSPAMLSIPAEFTETGNHYLRMQDETEYLRVDDANDFNLTNEGSILLWFQADPVQPVIPGAGLHAIVAKYEGHSPNPFEIRFSDERATEKRRIYVHLWDMTNNPFLWSPPNIDTNFHHVAYVKKGKTHLLYLDGLLVDYDSFDLGNLANDHPMYIGRNGAGRAFNGAVDDVQFWSRAVSQAEILHLMHNDPNLDDPSLIAYYDFDSQNGVDRSTYGNHGVVTAPIIPAPAPVLSPAHAFGIGVGNFFPTARYRLQSRNSLGATSPWMDVTNAVRADGHLFDVVGATTNRYYRIVTP